MSDVQVRPFRRADRDQLTRLVNAHAEAAWDPGCSGRPPAGSGWPG